MKNLIFITGGQRSGKSNYAQKIAENKSDNPVYLATSRVWDEDFRNRIERHKADRGDNWITIEEEKSIGAVDIDGKTVLLDCITLWLNNIFHDNFYDIEQSMKEAKLEWERLMKKDSDLIVVSNELGMGVHAENEASRKFADFQGWINQYIASFANEVFLMVSGIAVKIK